ncbi:cell wall-binding protein [Clostridium carboxidivorans P7]|uniref:Putative cell wall binding repeat 2-containing protein n=1 Tax=Clostridium carboxidivorans P7 TaxID=536227 RepID=C6PV80_9CLOT|nr:cell wall-binding repeat-containing protein [Clostridium carboxidivorans]AKN30744.1 cell wall-binding protein [Clostridium carboxidivorans P7]EET86810.1 putative cell wall binding repeat 2-containing protein [Clostridium carboxidivorans P7]EFG88553.1 hypothetical protein CLCAR_1775 [Clostridium carboxidivorans P7]
MKKLASILLTTTLVASVMCTPVFAKAGKTVIFNGGVTSAVNIFKPELGVYGTTQMELTNIDSQANVKMDTKELMTYLDDDGIIDKIIYTDDEDKSHSISSIVKDLNKYWDGVPVYYASSMPTITAKKPMTAFMYFWKGDDATQATFIPKYWTLNGNLSTMDTSKTYDTMPAGHWLFASGTSVKINKPGKYLFVLHDCGAVSPSPLNIICVNVGGDSSTVTTENTKIKANNVARLAGADRYKTAVAISQSGWTQSDNVILADGNNYPDALVGSSYAYLKDAPVLTTPSDKLNSDISNEITRLKAKTVYMLGNKTSISQGVEDELSKKCNVVRICGTDIFDTAVKVGEEIRKTKSFDTVAISSQGGFADALAIAPFSAKNTMPILFSGKDSLRNDTLKALKDWGIKNVVIVGGTGVISSSVEDSLKSMGITVTRLAGQDRYATALEIIKHFAPSDGYKSISISSGENYPDALAGAALAAKNNTPLVLVSKESVSDAMAQYINKNTLDKSYIFGGTGVVTDKVIGK